MKDMVDEILFAFNNPLNIFLAIILEFLILFYVSRSVKIRILRGFFLVSKSKKLAVYFFSILFLPGTYLHEIAHYMTALILGVNAGELEITPEINSESIKLGSVKIAKTDPIRRFVIGVAPVSVGVFMIMAIILLTYDLIIAKNYWVIAFVSYFVFEIGNTLFLSKKDMEDFWQAGLIMTVIGGVLYYLNNRFNLGISDLIWRSEVVMLLKYFVGLMMVPIVVDFVILGVVLAVAKGYDILTK